MSIWLKKWANLVSIFEIPRVPQHGEVVRQTADGNVLLQLGYYLTEEDIDRLKTTLL